MRGNARSVEGGADIGTRCNFVRMLIVGRNGSIEKKSEYLYRGEKLGRGWGWVIAAMIGKGAFDFVLHLYPFRFNSLSHFAPFYSLHLLESSLSIFRCVRGRLALRTKVFLLNRSPRLRIILRSPLRKRGARIVYLRFASQISSPRPRHDCYFVFRLRWQDTFSTT